MSTDFTKFYIITYTKYTHDHLLSIFTSRDDIQFKQQVIYNQEQYGQMHVRCSTKIFNELKNMSDNNLKGLSFNIEYTLN